MPPLGGSSCLFRFMDRKKWTASGEHAHSTAHFDIIAVFIRNKIDYVKQFLLF